MYRLLIAAFVALFAMPLACRPAFPRVVESADAVVAAKAMPAVVNIAIWKLLPPEQPGGAPRRVKAYGSGFIIDPIRDHRHQPPRYRQRARHQGDLPQWRSGQRQAGRNRADDRPRGGEGGCRPSRCRR